ncbi:MAG: stage V sporulation protein AA [Cellulosilyticaceae bacterium]
MPDIYVRPFKTTTVIKKKDVLLSDIAEVSAPENIKKRVEEVCVKKIVPDRKANYLITIIEIIDGITKQFPDATVSNVGEMDVIVQYLPKAIKENLVLEWIKVIGVCIVIFAGATVAIMAYQTDVSLAKTFTILNKVFTGQVDDNPLWITIPYSIGLPLGVLIFFNHIGNKKLTDDPTPVEVELNAYQTEIDDSIIGSITKEKRGQLE